MRFKTFEEYSLKDSLFGDSEDAPMSMEVEDEFAEKFYNLYYQARKRLGVDKAKALIDRLKTKMK